MPQVIFVGAGPVGLFTAIQLKLYNPKISILMLEKHEEYQRKHPLMLDKHSFQNIPSNSDLQKFVNDLPLTIRTNELETLLLDYAKGLGIDIEYRTVTDCQALTEEYPETNIIVGSDGSHSVVHEQVFGHEYQIKKILQYIAEMKYEVEGNTRYLNKLMETIPVTTYTKHFVSEFIGKEKEGKTPVSLRIFIDEDAYEDMKEATFKNPFKLSDSDRIDASVYRSIKTWIIAREELAGEERIEGSERITTTHVPVYASKEFVQQTEDKTWFLVGDAAFGMPFFRSLNNGILCSSQLAKVIHALLNGIEKIETAETAFSSNSLSKELNPAEYYQHYVNTLVTKENFIAEVKNMGVNSMETSAFCMQKSYVIPVIQKGKLGLFSEGRNFKERMKGEKQAPKGWCPLF